MLPILLMRTPSNVMHYYLRTLTQNVVELRPNPGLCNVKTHILSSAFWSPQYLVTLWYRKHVHITLSNFILNMVISLRVREESNLNVYPHFYHLSVQRVMIPLQPVACQMAQIPVMEAPFSHPHHLNHDLFPSASIEAFFKWLTQKSPRSFSKRLARCL